MEVEVDVRVSTNRVIVDIRVKVADGSWVATGVLVAAGSEGELQAVKASMTGTSQVNFMAVKKFQSYGAASQALFVT